MKSQSTTKGFAVLSAAGMIVKVLSLVYIPILLRLLGETGYGIYLGAYVIYVFVYVLANSGIPVAISKLVSELTAIENHKDAFKSFKMARFYLIILGIITSVLLFVFARPISTAMGFPESTLAVRALSPTLLFTCISSAYRGFFQGKGNMVPTAVSQIVEQIVNTIFTLVFAALLLPFGVEAACAGGTVGTSLGAFVSVLILTFYMKKNKKFIFPAEQVKDGIKRLSSNRISRLIASYSIPLTVCVGLQYAGSLVDSWNTVSRLEVAGFASQAKAMYGQLSRFTQLTNVPISFIVALAVALLPSISGAKAVNDIKLIQRKINYSFKLNFLISIPSAVGLAALSQPIYRALGFGQGSTIMLYGSIILILMALVQVQTSIMQGLGKMYTATFALVTGLIIKIAVNYFTIAIPQVNIYGAILGTITGYLIPILVNSYVIKKDLKIHISLIRHAIKPILASIVMLFSIFLFYYELGIFVNFNQNYLTNLLALMINIGIAACFYGLILILIGGIKQRDLELIPAGIRKFIPKFVIKMIN